MGHTIRMNSDGLRHAREAWRFRGQVRPPGAVVPGPGQESVWDYPRPPVIVDDTRPIEVRLDDVLIAETRAARRVLETASPPTFYLPPESVHFDCLQPDSGSSFCEWKGRASYFSVCAGSHCVKRAAWTYTNGMDSSSPKRHPGARLEVLITSHEREGVHHEQA